MYRVFCESYNNYIAQNNSDDYRSKIAEPLALIVDPDKFNDAKENETNLYKRLCDLLYFMEKSKEQYPRFNAFLWTIESRGMVGKHYGIVSPEDLQEQAKLINMFLKLVYWSVT